MSIGTDYLHALREQQVAEEQAIVETLENLAADIAKAAERVWAWGDGEGGYVRSAIEDAFEREGLKRLNLRRLNQIYSEYSKANRLRLRIFERDAYRCQNCGDWHKLEVDHVIPKSKGGETIEENLQTLCAICNLRKGAKLPEYGKVFGMTNPLEQERVMGEQAARIWEEVLHGDKDLRSTWLSDPTEVCRACRAEKPTHKEDCPIAALEARLSKMEGLENLMRSLDTPTAEALAAMIKANRVPSPWRDAGIRLNEFGNWLIRASRMDKALAGESEET